MLIGNYFKNVNFKHRNHSFSNLSFHSSECKKNSIFFAIKGNLFDGNKFIKDAVKKGAKTIVSNQKFEGVKKKVLYIRSKNVRKTLSIVSFKLQKSIPKNMIAVTGTNGKSSIANFYFQLLKFNKKKVGLLGTLGVQTNNRNINVSNTTLDPIKLNLNLNKFKRKKIDNVILEASSHGLKQNRLDGLNFNTAIFTNLSHDHLDYHKNFQDYLNSKLYLFKSLLKKGGNIICDNQIPQYKKIIKIAHKRKLKINTISNKVGDISVISHKYFKDLQIVNLVYKNIHYSFSTNLIGKIQIKNILMSVLAAEKSGLKFKDLIKKIKNLKPVNGRIEKIGRIKNNSLVILDYAHTPDALKICLQNIKQQFQNRKIHLVFGCGGDRDKYKRPIMGKLVNEYCEKIYLTDDNPRKENPKKIRKEIKSKINKSKLIEIPSRKKAIAEAIKKLKSRDILIVAGKGHENIQDYGKSKFFFSDKDCILKFIDKKNNKLSNNLKLNIIKEESKNKNFPIKSKIKNASINSKEIKKNDIFFAIKGKKKDGNLYLKEAFKKGASLAIVNKFNKLIKKSKQIKVKNSLDFLTTTAKKIRENSSSKIIAITGSCGKTSLKELLSNTLGKFGKVTASPKSFNNKYGVPLSLFNLNTKDNFGIFEVGMDKKGEIDFLSEIIKPDVGIITNISYAHAKNFKNINEIALAKAEIIKNIKNNGILVLNADDKFFSLHKKIASKRNLKIYSFSTYKKNADISLNNIKKDKNKYKLNLNINNKKKCFLIASNFENYIKNILAAITVISIFKDATKLNKNIFYDFKMPDGRGDISKIKINKKNIFLIDESYNSNPLSLVSAIKNFNLIKVKSAKKHLLLGDMLELGKHSKKLHSELIPIINSSSIDKVNIFGKHIKETYKNINISKKGLILNKTSEIISLIKSRINNNDYLMIKGSNATGLNKLTKNLKLRNLNAL